MRNLRTPEKQALVELIKIYRNSVNPHQVRLYRKLLKEFNEGV